MDGGNIPFKPMKQVSPWSVKGVEPDVREAAKMAARKTGVTIGAWLSGAIMAAAADKPAAAAQDSAETTGNGLTVAVDNTGAPAVVGSQVMEEIEDLKESMVDLEERLVDTIEPMMRKVRRLSSQMEEVHYLTEKMEALTGLQARIRELQSLAQDVEKVHRLEDQMRELERRSTDHSAIQRLENEIKDLRTATRGAGNIDMLQEQIRDLQLQARKMGDFERLEEQIRDLQKAGGSQQVRDLEQQVAEVLHRIDDIGEQGSFEGAGEQLEQLEEMIEDIQRTSQSQVAEQAEHINVLTRELEELKSISATASAGPMERAMTRLAERVQKIEEGHEQGKGGLFG